MTYYCPSCTKQELTQCKECGEIILPKWDEKKKKYKPRLSHRHTETNSRGESVNVFYPCVVLKIFHQHNSRIGRMHFPLPLNWYPDDFSDRKILIIGKIGSPTEIE